MVGLPRCETGVLDLDLNLAAVVFVAPAPDGRFDGAALKSLQGMSKKRKIVLLAFPPRAAGTFLRQAMAVALNGELRRLSQPLEGRDASPCLPNFVVHYVGTDAPKVVVTHAHMLALPANLNLLETLSIRPVVMKRSIPDMLASYWDMLDHNDVALLEGLNYLIPHDFQKKSREAKADFLIDILVPWYVSFYAGWLRCTDDRVRDVCLIDYRDLRDNPAGALQRVLRHVGESRDRDTCAAVVADTWKIRSQLRFNSGIEGRGGAYFNGAHLERLARLLRYYPNLAPHAADLLDTGLR